MKLAIAKIQHREGTQRVWKHYAYGDEDAGEVEKSFVSKHGGLSFGLKFKCYFSEI